MLRRSRIRHIQRGPGLNQAQSHRLTCVRSSARSWMFSHSSNCLLITHVMPWRNSRLETEMSTGTSNAKSIRTQQQHRIPDSPSTSDRTFRYCIDASRRLIRSPLIASETLRSKRGRCCHPNARPGENKRHGDRGNAPRQSPWLPQPPPSRAGATHHKPSYPATRPDCARTAMRCLRP